MTEDNKDVPPTDITAKTSVNKPKERKTRNRPLTKIILRRLPPTMTEETFLDQVSPIPEYDYFYFTKPDMSLGPCAFSRAYINFVNVDDIYLFKDKFDGYIFLDEKGVEYTGIVEYAPFQRIPKRRRKKDPKCGTIESDPVYQEFLESLKEPENESREPKLEYSYQPSDAQDKKAISTPLLDFLAARKQEKRAREERRRRDAERRKPRVERKKDSIKEEDVIENEVKKIKSRDWERDKAVAKKKDDDSVSTKSGTGTNDGKDTKNSQVKSGSRSFRESRKYPEEQRKKGDAERKDTSKLKESNSKDKRDKVRDSLKDQKPKESKKYSDIRSDRIKNNEKKPENEKFEYDKTSNTEVKSNSSDAKSVACKLSKLNSEIKPFTQLPKVKTEDLSRVIDEMDKNVNKLRLEEKKDEQKPVEDGENDKNDKDSEEIIEQVVGKCEPSIQQRRSSLESTELACKEDNQFRRHKSLDEKSKSVEADEVKDKNDIGGDPRTERRIRNKDRPSLAIYQPGMGRFSKQRISQAKDKDASTTGSNKSLDETTKET